MANRREPHRVKSVLERVDPETVCGLTTLSIKFRMRYRNSLGRVCGDRCSPSMLVGTTNRAVCLEAIVMFVCILNNRKGSIELQKRKHIYIHTCG